MAKQDCTAIVAFEVRAEDTDKFLTAWKKANTFLEKQDGYLKTALHRASSANPDFRFVNVSSWESAEAFRKATQSVAFKEASGSLEAYPIHASVYDAVRS